ncbi:MAG: PAS domain S-box protein [Syntrophobacteraceae bacterium]
MSRHRILVVEDEAIVSMEIEERLIRMGYEPVGIAASGEEALALAGDRRPDLILMDIQLQGDMDGITVAEEIGRRYQLPVIFLTAYSEESTLERARLAEPYGYILKPFDDRDLKCSVEIALHKHKADEEIRRLNRLYDVLSQTNQAVVRAQSREELLDTVCRMVVERGCIDLAWIGALDPDASRIRSIAHFEANGEAWKKGEHGMHCLAGAPGEPVKSITEGRHFVCDACIGKECPYPFATAPGSTRLHSCGWFPIHFQGRVWGVLSLGVKAAGFFLQREIDLLNEVALDLSFALDKLEGEARRDQAEAAMRASEAKFRSYIEHSPMGVFVADRFSRLLEVNPVATKMLGYTAEELLELSIPDFLASDSLDSGLRHFHTVGDEGSASGQYRMRRKDGTPLWASVSAVKLDDNRFLAFSQDITEQRQATSSLWESEERLRLFIEHAPASLAMFDREMRYLSASRRWLDDYYLGDRNLTGLSHYEVFPEIPERWKAVHRRGLSGEVVRAENDPFERADGSVQWLRWEVRPWHDSRGDIAGIVIFTEDITQRILAEETVAERERYLRTILETTADGYWVVDGNGGFIDVNEAYCRMSGYSRSDLLTMGISHLEALEEPGDIEARIEHIRESGSVIFESRHRRKNGSVFDVQVSATYLDSVGGQIVCFCRDITERKQAENALKEEVIRRRTLMDQSRDGIVIMDQHGKVAEANPAFAAMLGYSMEETSQLHVWDWEARMSQEELKEAIRRIDASGDHFITLHRRKDGSLLDVEITSTATVRNGQKLIFCVCRDISERLSAEQALRESERRYRMVADYNYDWEYWIGPDGELIYISPSCERITGYSAEEFSLDPTLMTSIIHPEDGGQIEKHKAEAGNSGGDGCQADFRIVTRAGDVRWISHFCQSIRSEDGIWLGRRASNRDVTDRVKAVEEKAKVESQLRQAQKLEAIGTLAGGIAHDFNNVLSPIIGYTEMALDDIPESSTTRYDLEQVLTAASRAKELVKQILTFSRLKQDELMRPTDIDMVLREALNMLRASLPSTVEIRQNLHKGSAVANATEIHQVVVNLCTNAAHAMHGRGTLDVSLTEVTLEGQDLLQLPLAHLGPGSYLKTTVKDTGHGMRPEIMDQIFDPYFTTKGVGEGTGLGLAVVHGIVMRHGGAITVQSTLGEGSVFDVYLPATLKAMGPEIEHTEALPRGDERILLVDDEPMIVDMSVKMLTQLGYRVTASTDPTEALATFRSDPDRFDLVITDFTMPRLTGMDLAKGILVIRPETPILLCTGFNERLTPEMVDEAGIRQVVLKPFEKRRLAKIIREVLGPGKN